MNNYFNNNKKLMAICKHFQNKEKEFMRKTKRYFIIYHLLKKIQIIIKLKLIIN